MTRIHVAALALTRREETVEALLVVRKRGSLRFCLGLGTLGSALGTHRLALGQLGLLLLGHAMTHDAATHAHKGTLVVLAR